MDNRRLLSRDSLPIVETWWVPNVAETRQDSDNRKRSARSFVLLIRNSPGLETILINSGWF